MKEKETTKRSGVKQRRNWGRAFPCQKVVLSDDVAQKEQCAKCWAYCGCKAPHKVMHEQVILFPYSTLESYPTSSNMETVLRALCSMGMYDTLTFTTNGKTIKVRREA